MGGVPRQGRAQGGGGLAALEVREVVPGDGAALQAIIRGSENLTAEEMDCAEELLGIYLESPGQDDYLFLAAVKDAGLPLGFVCWGPAALATNVYELYWIIVDPAHRHAGVGRTLLERVGEILRLRRARLLMAETSGLPAYLPARSFYTKNGFREEGRIKGFYKPGDDLVIYVKRFQPNND